MITLDMLQKQLDDARIAVIRHDNAYDDDMPYTYKDMNRLLDGAREYINLVLEQYKQLDNME